MLSLFAVTNVLGAQSSPDPSESPLWQVAARGRGLPAVAGDRVFALTADHDVLALSVADGRELWRRSTRERGSSTEGLRVLTANGVVVAGDWALYAFDAATGNPRWEFHPAEGYGPGHFLGVIAGTQVLAGSPSGSLYAVDLETGRPRWRAAIERVTETGPLTSVYEPVSNGRIVVVGYTTFTAPVVGGVVAVDADSGRERWRFRFPADDASPAPHFAGGPVLTDDLAIATGGDGRIWAFDLASGAVRWSIPRLAGPIDGIITTTDREQRALAVIGDRLIVGSLTGYLTAYDLTTRREVWQRPQGWLGSLSWHPFAHADGVVYVPFVSGFLHAIDVATGAERWRTLDYRRGFLWPVAVAGDRVIVAAASGIWALAAPARTPPPDGGW